MNLKKLIKTSIIVTLSTLIFIWVNKLLISDKNRDELNNIIRHHEKIADVTNNSILKDFFINDEEGKKIKISDLLKNESKIIFRFSELHCDSCILYEFNNIKRNLQNENLKIKDLILLTHYQNPRNLHIFKRINKLQNFIIYNILDNSIEKIEVDQLGVPYFFTLDSKLNIANTFIPIKGENKRTNNYLEKVSNNIN